MKRVFLSVLAFFCALSLFPLDIQQDIVQKAQQYVGSTYLSGGTTPPQFDCSGFVDYILKPFVPDLPRASRDMANAGTKIRKEDLEPGDLVFFTTTPTPNVVSHVALYIGQDSIIHSISDGPKTGVTITPLSARYWKNHYYGAVRVLPVTPPLAAQQNTQTQQVQEQTQPASPAQQNKAAPTPQVSPAPQSKEVPRQNAQTQPAANKPAIAKTERTEKPIHYAKGIYTGELLNCEPHGKGTLKLNNGDVYTGDFDKGSFSGKGTYTWKNGEKYEGEFKNDTFNGKGTYTDSTGNKQAVVFNNGKLVTPSGTEAGKVKAKPVVKETYIQEKDSPWDTWNGYVTGDYGKWQNQQNKDFKKLKNSYDSDKEKKEFEDWKKTNR